LCRIGKWHWCDKDTARDKRGFGGLVQPNPRLAGPESKLMAIEEHAPYSKRAGVEVNFNIMEEIMFRFQFHPTLHRAS
jgi:hypothetical protein